MATMHPKALEVIVRLHSPWLSHLVSRAEHTATAEAATSRRRAIAAECNGAARQRMKPQEAQCCGMQLCETQNKPSRQKERSCVHDAVISQPVAYSREFFMPRAFAIRPRREFPISKRCLLPAGNTSQRMRAPRTQDAVMMIHDDDDDGMVVMSRLHRSARCRERFSTNALRLRLA